MQDAKEGLPPLNSRREALLFAAMWGSKAGRSYLTSMSSYSCVPRPIFSAWSMQLFQSVSGCVT